MSSIDTDHRKMQQARLDWLTEDTSQMLDLVKRTLIHSAMWSVLVHLGVGVLLATMLTLALSEVEIIALIVFAWAMGQRVSNYTEYYRDEINKQSELIMEAYYAARKEIMGE